MNEFTMETIEENGNNVSVTRGGYAYSSDEEKSAAYRSTPQGTADTFSCRIAIYIK